MFKFNANDAVEYENFCITAPVKTLSLTIVHELTQTQGVLSILLGTCSTLGSISYPGCGIADGTPCSFCSISNRIGHALGRIAKGVTDSANWGSRQL